jgi:hypothetical protein
MMIIFLVNNNAQNVPTVKEKIVVETAEVRFFANTPKINTFAGNVMLQYFVFMVNKNHDVENVVSRKFVITTK